MTWTTRVRKSFHGIKGMTDRESVTPHLATIGRLRKGQMETITRRDGSTYEGPVDLDYFRFTSDRPDVVEAFQAAYGETPKLLDVYLPYPLPEENFQTCCEEWRGGGLVHRCDGETMSLWQDKQGVYHTDPQPCPYFGHPELRVKADKKTGRKANPGCGEVGRLNVILPGLLAAGYTEPVLLVTTAANDIIPLSSALQAIAEEQEQSQGRANLRGILWTLRRVPENISTPNDGGIGRLHRESYLVRIAPAIAWTMAQLARAQREALPELEAPWQPQPPDWEEVTHPGRTVAEVERDEFLVAEPGAEEGKDEEPGGAETAAPAIPAATANESYQRANHHHAPTPPELRNASGSLPPNFWTRDSTILRKFWRWANQDRALTEAEVHLALGVEHLAEFPGDKRAAVVAIEAYISKALAAQQPAPEPWDEEVAP
jgi:hypothetical protein